MTTVFFPDVSHYQAGLTIQPGTVAVLAKATEGSTYRDPSYRDFKDQAAAVGAVFGGYHWLWHGNLAAQAANYYSYAGKTPCMIDFEENVDSVNDAIGFAQELRKLGGVCNLLYLPHWRWEAIGRPSLVPALNAGLHLVSSNYTTYSDNGPGWAPYGGVTPVQWQYTSTLPYGGYRVDFNAFKGTPQEYAALLGYEVTEVLTDDDIRKIATATANAVLNRGVQGSGIGDGSVIRTLEQCLADQEQSLDPYKPKWQNEALTNSREILKAVKALSVAAPDLDALAAKIAAALVASNTNGLTAADHAAIVADIKSVFADAGS